MFSLTMNAFVIHYHCFALTVTTGQCCVAAVACLKQSLYECGSFSVFFARGSGDPSEIGWCLKLKDLAGLG